MTQIWYKTFKGDKLQESQIFDFEGDPPLRDLAQEASNAFDYPTPVILKKHEKDFLEFNLAKFLPSDFMETVPFDRMEIEYVPIEESCH